MSTVTDTNRAFILASGSPRRRALMEQLGFEPEVVVSRVPEEQRRGESAVDYTRRLAVTKAEEVAARLGDDRAHLDWVLAADTVVVFGGEVLEKPTDAQAARAMLGRLAGTEHRVETAFCWLQRSTGKSSVRSVGATVELRALGDQTIARYVDTGEPFDKAGGYGIQDVASAFVRSVDGSYFSVVGLPVCEVVEELERLGGLQAFPFRD